MDPEAAKVYFINKPSGDLSMVPYVEPAGADGGDGDELDDGSGDGDDGGAEEVVVDHMRVVSYDDLMAFVGAMPTFKLIVGTSSARTTPAMHAIADASTQHSQHAALAAPNDEHTALAAAFASKPLPSGM